jgi:hypothetical protein
MRDAYHQVEVDIVDTERLQRRLDALFDPLVPRVIELGRDPDLLAGHARVLDSLPDLVLVSVRQSRVNVSVALLQSDLDGFAHLIGLRLPGTQAHGGHLGPGVEGKSSLGPLVLCHFAECRSEHEKQEQLKCIKSSKSL